MNYPLVYVVILVFNGKKWIEDCLNSVLESNYQNFKVVAVDNGSQDGSAAFIREKFQDMEMVINNKNYGSAGGNNIGLRYSIEKGADYVFLLNQDTKVDPEWIQAMVDTAENDGRIGGMVPFQYDYEGKELDKNFENNIGDKIKDPNDFIQEELIVGAGMFFRVSMLEKIGLFDPIYFIYREENDFFRRAGYYGYKMGALRTSKIMHWDSWVHRDDIKGKMKRLVLRNELIYYLKNPHNSVLWNIASYMHWKFGQIKYHHGLWKGILSFMKLMALHVKIVPLLPKILRKKVLEVSTPCYLEGIEDKT